MKLLWLDRIHECIISWVGSMLNVMLGSHRLHVFPSNFQRKKMPFRKRYIEHIENCLVDEGAL